MGRCGSAVLHYTSRHITCFEGRVNRPDWLAIAKRQVLNIFT
jgi:hypothetical protein